MLLVSALCACTARMSCRAFEGVMLLGFCVLATVLQCLAGVEDDPRKSSYFMGMSRFCFKPVPIIIGMRPMTYAIFLAWSSVGDVVLLVWAQEKFGMEDSVLEHFGILLAATAAFIRMERMANGWIGAVYQSHCQVSQEKDAQESLLFTFCDGTIWLGADADTILHCDRRFSLMLGRDVEGTRLSDHVLQTPEEQARLRAAFEHLAVDAHGAPPAALHTAMLGGDGGVLGLELRIADRRGSGGGRAELASQRGSFLIGVRIEAGGVPGGQPPLPPPAAVAAGANAAGGIAVGAPAPLPEVPPAGPDEEPPLPELQEAVVEFETASPNLTLRSVVLQFAAPTPELQVPELVNLLPRGVGEHFRRWAQGHANLTLQGRADRNSAEWPPDFGPVMVRVTLGLALVCDAAHLEVLEDADDEALPARLHLRGLHQSDGSNIGPRGLPPEPLLPPPRTIIGAPESLMQL